MATNDTNRLVLALEEAERRFIEQNQASKVLHEDATKALPGGNTRTILHTSPFPLYMKKGKDHQVVSEDGRTSELPILVNNYIHSLTQTLCRYTDLTGEFTAALYGHSNPEITSAITHAIQHVGMNVGATTAQETVFAKELCSRFHLERVRFANSGTEANLHALAAARIFTGKRKIVAFGGAYHGGVLGFAGGKPAANNVDVEDWIVAKYNDLDSAKEAIQSAGVAAVILEGMQGAGGCFPATAEFLQGVQQAASAVSSLETRPTSPT